MSDTNTLDPAEQGNPERPDWLPEKFKTPEDFVKSYGELEGKLGELSERAKQADALEDNYNELAARFEQFEQQARQPQQTGNEAHTLIAQYQDAYERGDAAQMLAVNAQVSRLAVQEGLAQALPQLNQQVASLADSQAQEIGVYAARTLEQRYGNQWDEAREDMQNILAQAPYLIPEQAKTDPAVAVAALDNVYKLATAGKQPQEDPAAARRAAAEAAQTESGAGTRVLTPDQQKQEWDAIRNAGERPYWASLVR